MLLLSGANLGEVWVVRLNHLNKKKNAGNPISEHLNFKNYPREDAPSPPYRGPPSNLRITNPPSEIPSVPGHGSSVKCRERRLTC